MKNFTLRGITGAAFVAAIIAALTLHPFLFLGLFAAVVGAALWEFYGLTERIGLQPDDAAPAPRTADRLGGLVSGLYHRGGNPSHRWAVGLLAQAYAAGTFATLNFIVFNPADTTLPRTFHSHYALLLFVLIWLNDTGAYFVGSAIGRRKLFPRISPGKSWEGFLGGLVIVACAALLLAPLFPELACYHRVALSLIIVGVGTWGDLVESLIKRTAGAKDSGTLLPGHGGILDRFDSVMLAAPAALLYLEVFVRRS